LNLRRTHIDVFDVFPTTTELTERVSNLRLSYNGVSAAVGELVGYMKIEFTRGTIQAIVWH